MKPRRVFVTLELETSAPLKHLRDPHYWHWDREQAEWRCLQAQANVAQKPKKKGRGKK